MALTSIERVSTKATALMTGYDLVVYIPGPELSNRGQLSPQIVVLTSLSPVSLSLSPPLLGSCSSSIVPVFNVIGEKEKSHIRTRTYGPIEKQFLFSRSHHLQVLQSPFSSPQCQWGEE